MGKGIVNWIMKGKIIESRPCEKTSFFFAGALFTVLYFSYLIYTNQYQYTMNYFYYALGALGAGYLGLLYYRVRKGKKPYFIFNFWGKY